MAEQESVSQISAGDDNTNSSEKESEVHQPEEENSGTVNPVEEPEKENEKNVTMDTLDFDHVIEEYSKVNTAKENRLDLKRMLATIIKFLAKTPVDQWHLTFVEKDRKIIKWKDVSTFQQNSSISEFSYF